MSKIEQSELRKTDIIVQRRQKNGEIKNVVFPNGLQAGLPKNGFNSGIKIPSTSENPEDVSDRLYAIDGELYYDGSSIGSGDGAPVDGTYIMFTRDATSPLTNERTINAGDNITFTDGGVGNFLTIAADDQAPKTAQYVVLATDSTLTAERVLTAGANITITDAGAGSTITVQADPDTVSMILANQVLGG